MKSFDLVAIGCGPAGEKGAAQAAYFGKKVAVIERCADIGGACINTGTVPSKTLRESALYFTGLRQRGLYGIDYSLRDGLTVQDFMHRKDQVVTREQEKVRKNLYAHSIELLEGEASFLDARTIRVRGRAGSDFDVRGEIILITTGSRPQHPPGLDFDGKRLFDSDTILGMDRIPESLIVVGGGVIGCEYASTFTALQVKVMLVDGRERVMPFLDSEISERLQKKLSELGVTFYFKERMASLEGRQNGLRMTLQSGKTIDAEAALLAAGRRAAVDGLNLEAVGISLSPEGGIPVNEHYQTAVPNVYAAGDVIGFPALASTSMEQARVAVCHAFDFKYKQRVASMLPMGIYTIPEISAVGETEESCHQKGIACEVGRANYCNNARGQIMGDLTGMLKIVFRREDRALLGIHAIGEGATELIHLGLMVMEAGGKIDTFIDSVFNFPTLSEMYKYAAYDGLGNLAGHKLREG